MYGPVSIDHELYLIVTTPIFDRNKTQVGTDLVLFQLAELKTIVQDHTGPGKSEKTILGVVDNKGQVRVFFLWKKWQKDLLVMLTSTRPSARLWSRPLI